MCVEGVGVDKSRNGSNEKAESEGVCIFLSKASMNAHDFLFLNPPPPTKKKEKGLLRHFSWYLSESQSRKIQGFIEMLSGT